MSDKYKWDAESLQGVEVTETSPSNGQILLYDSSGNALVWSDHANNGLEAHGVSSLSDLNSQLGSDIDESGDERPPSGEVVNDNTTRTYCASGGHQASTDEAPSGSGNHRKRFSTTPSSYSFQFFADDTFNVGYGPSIGSIDRRGFAMFAGNNNVPTYIHWYGYCRVQL